MEPTSNTGGTAASWCVDWLEGTLPAGFPLESARALFGGLDRWRDTDAACYGYRRTCWRGRVRLLCDAADDRGIRFILKGQACRQLEREQVVTDWPPFVQILDELGTEWWRVDVALEDRTGALDLEVMLGCVERREYTSCFRKVTRYSTQLRRAGEGRGIRFGGKSGANVLIYDKAAKEGLPETWTRVEYQARAEHTKALVRAVVVGSRAQVAALIRGQVEFKQRGGGKEERRWPAAPWWVGFLGEEKTRPDLGTRRRMDPGRERWFVTTVRPCALQLVEEAGAWPAVQLVFGEKAEWVLETAWLLKNAESSPRMSLLAARDGEGGRG